MLWKKRKPEIFQDAFHRLKKDVLKNAPSLYIEHKTQFENQVLPLEVIVNVKGGHIEKKKINASQHLCICFRIKYESYRLFLRPK